MNWRPIFYFSQKCDIGGLYLSLGPIVILGINIDPSFPEFSITILNFQVGSWKDYN